MIARLPPSLRRRGGGEWGIALLLAALAFALAAGGWSWRADRVVYDFGLGLWSRPTPPEIVIVAIDDASVAAIGRWPWRRAVHATLLARLAEARPRAVALDLILSEPDPDRRQDELLAAELRRAAPVVLPLAWQQERPGGPLRLLEPHAPFADSVRAGLAEAPVDADGVLRSTFLNYVGPDGRRLPHAALALLQAGGESPAPLALEHDAAPAGGGGWQRNDRFLIRYAGPPGRITRLSYVDLLSGQVPAERLAGRYVLVGMTAAGLGDTLATPVNAQSMAMPGVEVLANVLYTLRSGDTLRAVPPWLAGLLAALLVAALVAAFPRMGTRSALLLALGSLPLVLVASLLALGAGLWWSPLPYAAAAVLAYPLWSWRRLERAVDELDGEIRRLQPEAGPAPAEEANQPPPAVRDRLGARLDTLHVATETVRSARRFLDDTLARMPTAMLVADLNGRVLLANALAASLFELDTPGEMRGLDLPGLLVEFVTPEPVDWDALLAGGGAPGEPLAVEAQLARRGDFVIHVAGVDLLGQQRWVVTIADVAPIKQAQRRRDELLAFVSHDLRSPATSIMLFAELNQQGTLQTPRDELLAEVRRLAARTLQMSDDFVRVAHAESRPLNPSTVRLATLVGDVLADFEPQALAAGVGLNTRLADPELTWFLDAALVSRALGNLLSNAIKHSPRDAAVEVEARIVDDELVLRVIDAGPGLSGPQRQQLAQGSQGVATGDRGGVGLGLLFVQRVAARHRGRLVARAGANATGSIFELHLAAAPREQGVA